MREYRPQVARDIPIAVVILIILYFAFRYIAPFGAVVKYQFTQGTDSSKLSKLEGVENADEILAGKEANLTIPKQLIRKNIVTFNVSLVTQEISGVFVKMRFAGNPKEIKVGVRSDAKEKYTYKPLYQILLNELKPMKVKDTLMFWQKNPTFKSFQEFASALPKEALLATYYFDSGDLLTMKRVQAGEGFASTVQLRGSHTLFVRVDQAPFIFAASKQDANMYVGEDVLTVEVYKGDKLIATKEIGDDGVTDTSLLSLLPQSARFELTDIVPGVYRIVLKDNSKGADVRITEIKSNQQKVVFSNGIFIVDTRPTKLYTTAKELTAQTYHEESVQTIKLDGELNLEVSKTQEKYLFDLDHPRISRRAVAQNVRDIHVLEIPINDLVLGGAGYYAFSESSFFDPAPLQTVDVTTLKSVDSVDYIIANYSPAKKVGEYYEAVVYFDKKDLGTMSDKLYFSLESPGLEQAGGEIDLQNLEVTVIK